MVTFSAQVSPYSLETFGTWDRGLGWTAERDRCALLVHDLLPYYLSVLDQDLTTTLVDTVTQLLGDAHTHDVPVVASAPRAATTAAQRGLGGRLWGMGPTHDQTSTPALGQLTDPRIPWVSKRSLSAFYATDLDVELRRLGRDQLVIVGVFAAGGVLATTFDALARDIEVFTVADGVADYTEALHAGALETIASRTGQVCSAATIRNAWLA